ncbi:hypothetical protein [Odoribacter lunatus]|uniref:hypothetical protein n=1 Tax=Odoribacter lunatus TaxID=2941335 RepID=UPI0020400813|nr:hypothetical protein [Odoribacter lunatus]
MKDNDLQLRSEKTRKIIGKIPSRIVRYGTLVVSFMLVLLFIFSLVIKYPQYLYCQIQIIDDSTHIIFNRLDEIYLIQSGQIIKFYNSDENIYGILYINSSDEIKFNGEKYLSPCKIEIKSYNQIDTNNIVFSSATFNVKILYSEKSLCNIIIN